MSPQVRLTLELDENSYRGFDGTKTFEGNYVNGMLEAGTSGSFLLRPGFTTEAGYFTLEDIERAENYFNALMMGMKYRVENGQLDGEGQTLLVFVRDSTPR